MLFDLDTSSGIPIYRQIVDQIQRLVSSGQLQSGDELPSVRAVAEAHTVNPMTVSRAYALLEGEGWLMRRRGKPMQVASRPDRSIDDRLASIRPSLQQVALEARQLGLGSEDVIAELGTIMGKETS